MRRVVGVMAVLMLVFVGVNSCSDDTVAPTPALEQFTSTLTGAKERPNPVTTNATGQWLAEVRDTGTVSAKKDSLAVIRYQLNVAGINAVTASHIHAGGSDVAGSVMVFLYGGPTTATAFTGQLNQAEITRKTQFLAPFTFDSLMTRMRNGTAYVNVHTSANGGGEVRGQIDKATTAFTFSRAPR